MPAARMSARPILALRAVLAALAAIMITFSPDHSAGVGLAVFSGFAIATAVVLALGAWLEARPGRRWAPTLLACVSFAAGAVTGIEPLRSPLLFWIVVPTWAFAVAVIEVCAAAQNMRLGNRADARDGFILAFASGALAVGVLLTPMTYRLDYFIMKADAWFALTGDVIATGLFGAYAAVVAVFLFIAAFSPQAPHAPEAPASTRRAVAS